MWRVRISRLVQGPWPLFVLCLGVCLLFLYVLVQGGQQLPQPGSGEVDKLRVEVTGLREKTVKLRDEAAKLQEQISAQNEMIKKLQDQDQALRSKIDKMQGDLHGCRTESVKHGELVQGLKRSLENYEDQNSNLRKENEMIKKLQDLNRDFQSKIDKMQGDLQRCRTESGKHGELVQGLKRDLEYCGNQISYLQYDQQNCRSQSFKSPDDNIWWFIVPCVLGCFLGCCLGHCSKCINGRP